MASSSSSPSAMAFPSEVWKYHVFLSFRGEDTRKTFVDHLYTTLVQKGIYTYKDDETLHRGESIAPSLMKAIEDSQISVIVFSENYADSSWCLDELAHIMKCRDTRGQIVMPIFYDVDPSEVRKQKRKYGEAFTKHASENNTKVESWRKALMDASNLSGWDTKHIANGHESKCIQEIVDTISHRLYQITSSLDDNLVGVEARMQHLISKLHIGFGGKKIVGIWGVGGSGKTTLASSVYDEISSKFDGCCFLKNVREESSNKNGLEKLQEKVLLGVLKQTQVEVGRIEQGRRMIKDRLHHRKVLIVLDDVDKLEHLEQLAGSRDWFGEGSRIIITTRDEHVLTGHKVDVIHNISLLNNDEAMKLFCKHAPRSHIPIESYEVLSKEAVTYAGGLPLALRVLGRFLCDKEMNEWRSAFDRLKEIPDPSIVEVLKISYDGLTRLEKELFLHVACFFRGMNYWYSNEEIVMILDACGYHPGIGIKVLIQKALITVSDGIFEMHDLLQEMAHYIVRGEHPQNPEKHSRVWKEEDIAKICAMDATMNLDRIEAIDYGPWHTRDEQPFFQTVLNMKNLRWIGFHINSFLIVLSERKFKAPLMPKKFLPRELCCLTLNGLNQEQLWEGYKSLPNLRMIKLRDLRYLIKTPEFDGIPNLRTFIVEGCPLFEEIHPSFGHLEKLIYVKIYYCGNFKMIPATTRSDKLETLILRCCGEVFDPSRIQQNMENFVSHNINHIRQSCFSLCLRKLDLGWCKVTDGDIRPAAGWELPYLQQLHLYGNEFVRLDFSLLRVPQLKYLNISYCYELVELLELPSSIAVVIAYDCASLESFGDISNCKWLWRVAFWGHNTFWGHNKLGPLCGDILLDTILEGKAKDYFMSINLSNNCIRRGFVPRLNWVKKTFTMPLPYDWYNNYSGVLMFIKSKEEHLLVNIIIKQDVDEDSQSELGCGSNETVNDDDETISVGYVSFSLWTDTKCLNSAYNIISFSFSLHVPFLEVREHEAWFRAVLVRKDDRMQTTKVASDCSQFWNEEVNLVKTFRIQHDLNSSIRISWKPISYL